MALLGMTIAASGALAQSPGIDAAARRRLDANYQAWIDNRRESSAAMDALDCMASSGECVKSRAATESHLRERLAKPGPASTASAVNSGATRPHAAICEWVPAEFRRILREMAVLGGGD